MEDCVKKLKIKKWKNKIAIQYFSIFCHIASSSSAPRRHSSRLYSPFKR
jgi:hypothetical protein